MQLHLGFNIGRKLLMHLDALLPQHPLADIQPPADCRGPPTDAAFPLRAAEAAATAAGRAATGPG